MAERHDEQVDVNDLMKRPAAPDEAPLRTITTVVDFMHKIAEEEAAAVIAEHLARWHNYRLFNTTAAPRRRRAESPILAELDVENSATVRQAVDDHERSCHGAQGQPS